MKPGIYTDMNNEDYHAAPGWSTSNLKQAEMSVTVAENRELYSYDSPAFSLGTAVHSLVLEPEKFHDEMAVMPSLNLRTKAGKEEAAEFQATNSHKMILKTEDFDKASAMAASVLTIYGPTLAGCQNESSVFAEDETGLLRKCRPDSLCINRKIILDLKTTKEDWYWFGKKAIFDFSYDMQAAWYVDTCRLAGLEIDAFAFIVVSNIKPYYAFGYIATPELIASGREKYQRILNKISNKLQNNQDTLFHPTMIPGWRQAEMESI